MRIAEPIQVEEVQGGRYDGDFRVHARCAGCHGDVVHYLPYDEYGPSHRVADCELRLQDCGAGYDVVRPKPGMLRPRRWWEPVTPAMLFRRRLGLGFFGLSSLDPFLEPDAAPEARPEGGQAPPTTAELIAGLLATRPILAGLSELEGV